MGEGVSVIYHSLRVIDARQQHSFNCSLLQLAIYWKGVYGKDRKGRQGAQA
jgi:hypothetical protein